MNALKHVNCQPKPTSYATRVSEWMK